MDLQIETEIENTQEQTFHFYSSFRDLYQLNFDYPDQLKERSFRKYLFDQIGPTFELVERLAPPLTEAILKPQRLLYDDPSFYVAIDLFTNTYYVCYKELLMIDIDYYKDTTLEAEIVSRFEDHCRDFPEDRFRLFRTRNGLHAFLVSRKMNYKDQTSIDLMLKFKSDFYYVVYSYIRGWSVRLNKKQKDTQDTLYTDFKDIGSGSIDADLIKLINLHLNLVQVFVNVGQSMMYGT